MSRLSGGQFVAAIGVVMGLFAYLFASAPPVEARACGVLSNSFSCMSGIAEKAGIKKKQAQTAKVKVAAVNPADKVSDVTQVVQSSKPAKKKAVKKKSRKKKKASRKSRKKSYKKRARKGKKRYSRKKSRRNKRYSRKKSHRGKRYTRKSSRRKGRKITKRGWRTRNTGGRYMVARAGVKTSCFPRRLRGLLKKISRHYGKKLIITSGYRSAGHNRRIGGARRSQHIHCTAADFYIPGVNKMALARYMKRLPGRGGVGTYCGNRTVHLDVGPKRSWHYGCRKRRYARKRRAKRRYSSSRKRSYKRRYAAKFRGSRS